MSGVSDVKGMSAPAAGTPATTISPVAVSPAPGVSDSTSKTPNEMSAAQELKDQNEHRRKARERSLSACKAVHEVFQGMVTGTLATPTPGVLAAIQTLSRHKSIQTALYRHLDQLHATRTLTAAAMAQAAPNPAAGVEKAAESEKDTKGDPPVKEHAVAGGEFLPEVTRLIEERAKRAIDNKFVGGDLRAMIHRAGTMASTDYMKTVVRYLRMVRFNKHYQPRHPGERAARIEQIKTQNANAAAAVPAAAADPISATPSTEAKDVKTAKTEDEKIKPNQSRSGVIGETEQEKAARIKATEELIQRERRALDLLWKKNDFVFEGSAAYLFWQDYGEIVSVLRPPTGTSDSPQKRSKTEWLKKGKLHPDIYKEFESITHGSKVTLTETQKDTTLEEAAAFEAVTQFRVLRRSERQTDVWQWETFSTQPREEKPVGITDLWLDALRVVMICCNLLPVPDDRYTNTTSVVGYAIERSRREDESPGDYLVRATEKAIKHWGNRARTAVMKGSKPDSQYDMPLERIAGFAEEATSSLATVATAENKAFVELCETLMDTFSSAGEVEKRKLLDAQIVRVEEAMETLSLATQAADFVLTMLRSFFCSIRECGFDPVSRIRHGTHRAVDASFVFDFVADVGKLKMQHRVFVASDLRIAHPELYLTGEYETSERQTPKRVLTREIYSMVDALCLATFEELQVLKIVLGHALANVEFVDDVPLKIVCDYLVLTPPERMVTFHELLETSVRTKKDYICPCWNPIWSSRLSPGERQVIDSAMVASMHATVNYRGGHAFPSESVKAAIDIVTRSSAMANEFSTNPGAVEKYEIVGYTSETYKRDLVLDTLMTYFPAITHSSAAIIRARTAVDLLDYTCMTWMRYTQKLTPAPAKCDADPELLLPHLMKVEAELKSFDTSLKAACSSIRRHIISVFSQKRGSVVLHPLNPKKISLDPSLVDGYVRELCDMLTILIICRVETLRSTRLEDLSDARIVQFLNALPSVMEYQNRRPVVSATKKPIISSENGTAGSMPPLTTAPLSSSPIPTTTSPASLPIDSKDAKVK